MTGKLSKNFQGVGIGPLSKILAVNTIQSIEQNFLEMFTKVEILSKIHVAK